MPNPNARKLAGRYEIRSLIGRGGMAEVHLGFDTRLSRVVAVKILRMDLARDNIFQTRFRREAQAAASLNHPNIVSVYDTGEEMVLGADGHNIAVPFIVMEYVEGHTVKDLLGDGTAVPINEAVEITAGVLSALEYSHAAGLVHRDIKPGNIMLTNDAKVKVMDFGIARAMTDSQATMTQTNAVVGTAQYLSPEQARGEIVDERSDLYSAGCVLFELLTGVPPFKGDSAVSVAYQHVSEVPPVPSMIASDIPVSLDRVVLKALAKNPADRYASAALMRIDMVRAIEGLPVDAPDTSAWTQSLTAVTTPMASYNGPRRSDRTQVAAALPPAPPTTGPATGELALDEPPRKKRGWLIALIVILGLAIVGGILWLLSGQNKETPVETAAVPAGLIGMTQSEARAAIAEAGLVFVLGDPVNSDTIDADLVAKVDPASDTVVDLGTKVTVHLSLGKKSEKIPDMTGWKQAQVEQELASLGLVVGTVEEEDTPQARMGELVRTDPAMGSVQPRGTVVNLVFASGYVSIPDNLVGKPENEVRDTLRNLGLSMEVRTENNDSVAEGSVITVSQTGRVPQGASITVTVSSGPALAPEPTEPTTPTQPTDPNTTTPNGEDNSGNTGNSQPGGDANQPGGGNSGN